MQDNKLITLSRDADDKRRQTIVITRAGQLIVDQNSERAAQIVDGFKNTLGADDYEKLIDLLSRLDPAANNQGKE